METRTIGIYDGTFEGFLSSVAWVLHHRHPLTLRKAHEAQSSLFTAEEFVETDTEQARYLWEWVGQKGSAHQRLVYFAFLSEKKGVEDQLLPYLRELLVPADQQRGSLLASTSAPVSQLARAVADEVARLRKSLRFTPLSEQPARCTISPEADVLPLLSKELRQRFREQPWVLYDRKRHYGLYGSGTSVSLFSHRTDADPPNAFFGTNTMEPAPSQAVWNSVRKAV